MSKKVDALKLGFVDPDEPIEALPADEWVSLVDLLENANEDKRVSPAELATAIEQKGIHVVDRFRRHVNANDGDSNNLTSKKFALDLLADHCEGYRRPDELDQYDKLYTFGWPKNSLPDFEKISRCYVENAEPTQNPESEAERDASQVNSKPMQRQRHQEQEILRVLHEAGINPMKLPPNKAGKPGAKAEARGRLTLAKTVFDKAWERLSASKEIQYAG